MGIGGGFGPSPLHEFLLPLADCPEEKLRLDAVRALSTWGLLYAVESLSKITGQLVVNPFLKAAAGDAIRRVRSRCAPGA
ncbi:MAG: hypothetical protein JW881_08885 [Spirochaetales bacterium]|nr:hypothetical protein [Spirochaetales bacterium]